MRKVLLLVCFFASAAMQGAAAPAASDWKARVAEAMPLLGHRNWILVVDSAYPLQVSPGVETIETNASQLDAVQYVLGAINKSIHVRPLIYMDSELAYVPDQDAPGASAYRSQIGEMLHGYSVESLPHAKLLADVDEAGKVYRVLILKTNMAVPYTSVFIRLDCKYWPADAEERLRKKMASGQP